MKRFKFKFFEPYWQSKCKLVLKMLSYSHEFDIDNYFVDMTDTIKYFIKIIYVF